MTALAGGSPNPSVFGQPVVFQVSAVAPGVGVPTGLVIFTNENTGAEVGRAVLVNGQAVIALANDREARKDTVRRSPVGFTRECEPPLPAFIVRLSRALGLDEKLPDRREADPR